MKTFAVCVPPDVRRPTIRAPAFSTPSRVCFVSADKHWLHFAYDDARHRAVHYSAKLPPLPAK